MMPAYLSQLGASEHVQPATQPLVAGFLERVLRGSTPGKSRTCDQRFRKALLYPLSYGGGKRGFYYPVHVTTASWALRVSTAKLLRPMPKLTLHTYWRSSSAYRVRLALAYKGLAYEPRFVNLLANEQKDPDFVTQSPMGYVPCLVVDGKPFVESVAIIELLDELHPDPPLLPGTPEDRARVRALVEIINAGTQPLQNLAVLAHVGEQFGDAHDTRVAWMRHFMIRGLTAFETLLERHEHEAGRASTFCYGTAFGMADVYLLPQLYGARRVNVDLSRFPRILRAEKACQTLSLLVAAHPEAQPDAKP